MSTCGIVPFVIASTMVLATQRNDARDDAHREEWIRSCQRGGCSNSSSESFQRCMAGRRHVACVVRCVHRRRRRCTTRKDGQQMEGIQWTGGSNETIHHGSSMPWQWERCVPTVGRRMDDKTTPMAKTRLALDEKKREAKDHLCKRIPRPCNNTDLCQ